MKTLELSPSKVSLLLELVQNELVAIDDGAESTVEWNTDLAELERELMGLDR